MDLSGLQVVRSPDRAAANDVLAAACRGRVGLEGVLADLDRSCSFAHGLGPGIAWGLRWDAADERTRRWWPQGVTSSGDAGVGKGALASVVLTTAYRKGAGGHNEGSRVTVVDLRDPSAVRYRPAPTTTPPSPSRTGRPRSSHAPFAWGDLVQRVPSQRSRMSCSGGSGSSSSL